VPKVNHLVQSGSEKVVSHRVSLARFLSGSCSHHFSFWECSTVTKFAMSFSHKGGGGFAGPTIYRRAGEDAVAAPR
jgi:hypothetical protein